jgi:hypothetical protein
MRKEVGTMGRRLTASLLAMAMFLGLLVGTAGAVMADSNYTCPDKSCAFTVPDSYSESNNDATSVIFKDANSGGAFGVTMADGSSFNSLDDVVASVMSDASKLTNSAPGPNNGQSTVLGGNPATLIEFTWTNDSGTNVEEAVFVTLYQGKVYRLDFATAPENEDAFVAGAKPVFDSWQFQ